MIRAKHIACAAIAILALSSPSQAQYQQPWFNGVWYCNFGGVAGVLTWGINEGKPNPNATTCKGCVVSDGGTIGGNFSVVGLAPTYLTEQGSSAQAVYLQGDNSILWYLDDTATGPAQMSGRAGDAHGNWTNVTCVRHKVRPAPPFGQH